MGPRPLGRGKGYGPRGRRRHTPASMGPRPLGRGKAWRAAHFAPLPCVDGAAASRPRKAAARVDASWAARSVDGAAASRPRKAAKTTPRPLGRPLRRWGRGLSAAESVPIRRCPCRTCWRRWGRGLSAAESVPIRRCPCRTCWRRWGRGLSAAERARPAPERPDVNRRRWGRGLSAAESWCHCGAHVPII